MLLELSTSPRKTWSKEEMWTGQGRRFCVGAMLTPRQADKTRQNIYGALQTRTDPTLRKKVISTLIGVISIIALKNPSY